MESLLLYLLFEFGTEYHPSKKILTETRGVVRGIDAFLEYFLPLIENQINTCVSTKSEVFQIYENITRANTDLFFEKFHIEINAKYDSESTKPKYSGEFITCLSFADTKDGVICTPYIRLSISGNTKEKILETASFCLGHKLTHAYDLYQYARKNNYDLNHIMTNVSYDQNYEKIYTSFKNGEEVERFVSEILYTLNRMERNAYIGQLYQELENARIYNSASACKAIKQTTSYGRFLSLEKKILTILNTNLWPEVKRDILKYTNELTNLNFKNYEDLKKYYTRRWTEWKKKYLSVSSKIAYDIYLKGKNERKEMFKEWIGEIGL